MGRPTYGAARHSGSSPSLVLALIAACSPPIAERPVASGPAVSTTQGATAKVPVPLPPEPTYPRVSADRVGAIDPHVWPPPPVNVEAAKPEPKEGEWVAYQRDWLHTLEGAPPTFYTSFVRPDPQRIARANIVAMDARQLELDMAIGVEGPFPPDEKTSGKWPRFGGKLPREAGVAKRVVAAFNGGFRFDQGKWGMSIRRREFVPPVPDVASLLMFDDGRLGFGTWGPSMPLPADVRSLRQNLDPLVDGDEINPRKRPKWGGILATGKQVGQRAKRSGICRTAGGHLLYFWGNDLEAAELGAAMKKARCDYALHLDMNLYHVGFVFMSYDDAGYAKGKAEALSPAMGVGNTRYVHQPSPKEFFYAMLRTPPAMAPDGGAQPAPAWMPAVRGKTDGGVRLTVFEAQRVRLALVAGHLEPDAAGRPLHASAAPPPLPVEDRDLVLAAIRLGRASHETPLGLFLEGKSRVPDALGPWSRVAVTAAGRWSISQPGDLSATVEHTRLQAPAVLVDATPVQPLPRFELAVGVDARNNLLVVEAVSPEGTPAALVAVLQAAGCRQAIAPRGGVAKLERMGRDEIVAGGPDTRLYVLSKSGPPATFRFDLDDGGAPRWPKVTTPVK